MSELMPRESQEQDVATDGVAVRLSRWVQEHDDSLLFVLLYVGFAVVLSIAISLFWLVVVVAVHFAFEWHKQAKLLPSGPLSIAARSLWAVLLDVGLVFFALALALYIDLIFGVVGLGAAARVGVQGAARVGTRFAAWQGVLRGILLSLDDAVQIGRSIQRRRGTGTPQAQTVVTTNLWGGWTRPWSRGDRLCVGFTVLCLALILLAPVLSTHDAAGVIEILAFELSPFP
jgi:hypothetical protein